MIPALFIYKKVNGLICREKRSSDLTDGHGKIAHDPSIIFKQILTDEEADMTLNELSAKYPCPKQEGE